MIMFTVQTDYHHGKALCRAYIFQLIIFRSVCQKNCFLICGSSIQNLIKSIFFKVLAISFWYSSYYANYSNATVTLTLFLDLQICIDLYGAKHFV